MEITEASFNSMDDLWQASLNPTDLEIFNSHIQNLASANSNLRASRHPSTSHGRAAIPRSTTMPGIATFAANTSEISSVDPMSQSLANTPIKSTLDSSLPMLNPNQAMLGISRGVATPPNMFDMMFFDASPAYSQSSEASTQGVSEFLDSLERDAYEEEKGPSDFALERYMIQQQLAVGIHPKDVLPMLKNKPPPGMAEPVKTFMTTETGLARPGPDRPHYDGKLRPLPKHIRDSIRSRFQTSPVEHAEVTRFYSQSFRNLSGLAPPPPSLLQGNSEVSRQGDVTMTDPDETELEVDNSSEDLGSLFAG